MDIKFDLHTHTIASGHAFSTLKENAEEAAKKRLTAMGMSEHGPAMPGACDPIYFGNYKAVGRELLGVEILKGVEANIINCNGDLDLDPSVLEKMDYVIASLHVPCIARGTARENTDALVGAMRNPYVKIIGHPDDDRFPLEYERLVLEAERRDVLLEVNNASFKPCSGRQNATANALNWLRLARERRLPVVMGSDAHIFCDVGNVCGCIEVLEQAEYPRELILNFREDGLERVLDR